ncbi:hypothetical protein BDZ89DRAFT_1087911 [Hymenopellis radicata]|nr:hypothetical protein BDZ89DRAFT_1087911 [Hymenopellis radicata]
MNLARHSISATAPVHIFDARFDSDCQIFTTATPAGLAVYRTWPLTLIRKRGHRSLHTSSLLFLVGGGRSPLYPPNKVIIWNDHLGCEVAELEFRERVRGLACRRGWLSVALRRRVVVFEIGERVTRFGEWETCDNPKGLVAIATAEHSTLLVIPGRQMGHVQLVHLPPCRAPQTRAPPAPSSNQKPPPPPTTHPVSIIAAHTTSLTTLTLPPSGRLLATTSSRGTLVRIWDSHSGKLIRELRRGTDKADIFGVAFRPDEQEMCVWSDKGTVHVFNLVASGASNRQSSFSPLTTFLPLPKYFESEWSYAQYRIPAQSAHISLSSTHNKRSPTADIPDEERCVVGWIEGPSSDPNQPMNEYQLIALTYTGGWYRLSLPSFSNSTVPSNVVPPLSTSPPGHSSTMRPRASSGASIAGRSEKGKEKEKDGKEKRDCILQEFRRYGRWDGWG